MRSTILREFAGRTNVVVKLKLSELIRIAFSVLLRASQKALTASWTVSHVGVDAAVDVWSALISACHIGLYEQVFRSV
jgi:TPP-dependent indolepyruvate ferredoxin oxidoreductase alpha subunit